VVGARHRGGAVQLASSKNKVEWLSVAVRILFAESFLPMAEDDNRTGRSWPMGDVT